MQVTLSSKNVLLTDGLKTFITSKLEKLKKYSDRGLSNVQILLDVDRHKKGKAEDAIIEMIGDFDGKPITVRQKGTTFYTAFFKALGTMNEKLRREKEKLSSH